MEFHSDIKKNEIVPFTGKWMEVGTIMLSEINQSHKDKHSSLPSFVEARAKQTKNEIKHTSRQLMGD
jgi:hypothetical protein